MVSGNIILSQRGFVFESVSNDPPLHLEIPLNRLQLQEEEPDGLRFTDVQDPEWEVFTGDRAILDHPVFTQRSNLRMQARPIQQRREGTRSLKLAIIFLVAFGLIAVVATFLTRWTVQFLVSQIPVSWELRLASKVMEELPAKAVDDPKLTASLQSIADHLIEHLPRNPYRFRFRILKSAQPNAFALPGGTVMVTTGLLDLADRPEEVAGVLAHEMAHVIQRHGLQQLITGVGPYYVLKLFVGSRSGFMSAVAGGSQMLMQQSFSREHEREADDKAWKYLTKANIDPRGLASSLRKMWATDRFGSLEETPLKVLSSHPPTRERIDHLESLWKNSRRKSGFQEIR